MSERRQRRYSEEQIAEALALLAANGGSVRRTASQLGIPHTTLLQWDRQQRTGKNRAGHTVDLSTEVVQLRTQKRGGKTLPALTIAELRALKKSDLASAYEDIVWKGITRLRESDLIEESNNLVAISTATATAVDKMRLLKGESTVITETKLEQHRWAEDKIQQWMRDFDLSREEAITLAKEKAPTLAAMLM